MRARLRDELFFLMNFLMNFFLGGISATIAKTSVAPTERVKLILQTQSSSRTLLPQARYTGISDCLSKVVKQEGFKSLCNGTTLLDNSPMTYLRNRGVTEQDILYWKIGYTTEGRYRGRIIIPSFNLNGDLNYYVARTFTNSDFKYLNPPASKDVVFNELLLEWDEDLIITEGVFDAMEAGQNAVPLLGSTIRQNSKLFKKITQNDTPIFFALDPDARKKEDRMIKLFLTYGLEVYKIDITGHEDVAEMGREEFLRRKENAVPITGTDYLLESALSFI